MELSFIDEDGYYRIYAWEAYPEIKGFCAMGQLADFHASVYAGASAPKNLKRKMTVREAAAEVIRMTVDVTGAKSLLLCDRTDGYMYKNLISQFGKTVCDRRVRKLPPHVNANSGNEVMECILQHNAFSHDDDEDFTDDED